MPAPTDCEAPVEVWFIGIVLSTSWAVVSPCLAKSLARKVVIGSDVSEASRLIEEPVISTRAMGWGWSSWPCAGTASMANPAAAPPANSRRSERDKTVSFMSNSKDEGWHRPQGASAGA